MIWKPKQLGRQKIEERELEADKRTAGDSALWSGSKGSLSEQLLL